MVESRKPGRPKVRGVSRNPEYNLSIPVPTVRFRRSKTGKRLAPLALLNTRKGQRLAGIKPPRRPTRTEKGHSQDSDRRSRTRSAQRGGSRNRSRSASHSASHRDSTKQHNDHARRVHNSDHKVPVRKTLSAYEESKRKKKRQAMYHKRTDRDLLPSQRSRATINLPAILSNVNDALQNPQRSQSSSQINRKPVPRAYPDGPSCKNCVTVPQFLYQEYLEYFPECSLCGHMAIRLLHSMHRVGIEGLYHREGEQLLAPSRSIQDWFLYAASTVQSEVPVSRHDSKSSIATTASKSTGSLQRAKAMRRSSTSSSTVTMGQGANGANGSSRHPGLIPVGELRGKPTYTRRFSFHTDETKNDGPVKEAAAEQRPASAQEAPRRPLVRRKPLPAHVRLPFQGNDESDKEEFAPTRRAASSNDIVMLQYPPAIQSLISVDATLKKASSSPERRPCPTQSQEQNQNKKKEDEGDAEWNAILTTPARTFSQILRNTNTPEKAMPPFALRRKPGSISRSVSPDESK